VAVEQIEQDDVLAALRKYLRLSGFADIKDVGSASAGGTGRDASAIKGGETWAFECIGYAAKGPKRSRDFDTAVWQVLARLGHFNVSALCLPASFKRGMKQRLRNRASAWKALGKAFNGRLHIWFWDGGDKWEEKEWNQLLSS
jgi:hypothetical protein